ncbi:hypothetical protein U1710_11565, partial [Aeromonas caviae]|uniref:hypothetical protein n=1 Tax=Aeromonas caviae TaxID=648 RepID=UPI0030144381
MADILTANRVNGEPRGRRGPSGGRAAGRRQKKGSSRDPGKVEVDRQGAGKLVVAKHTTTITLLSPC